MKRSIGILVSLVLLAAVVLRTIQVLIGTPVTSSEHPWHVAIMASDTYKCGGTHVGNGWVLTALHCIDFAQRIGVVANTTTLKGSVTPLAECRPHKQNCLSVQTTWGLALIGFGQIVKDKVKSIALPTASSTAAGDVHVVGWGITFSDYKVGNLRGITLNVVPPSMCADRNIEVPTPGYCAAGKFDGLCAGDSGGGLYGGPLTASGTFYGVAQRAESCGVKTLVKPFRYASFSSLSNKQVLDWINAQTAVIVEDLPPDPTH